MSKDLRKWLALKILKLGTLLLTEKEWEEFVFQLQATWVNRCRERGYPIPSDFYRGF